MKLLQLCDRGVTVAVSCQTLHPSICAVLVVGFWMPQEQREPLVLQGYLPHVATLRNHMQVVFFLEILRKLVTRRALFSKYVCVFSRSFGFISVSIQQFALQLFVLFGKLCPWSMCVFMPFWKGWSLYCLSLGVAGNCAVHSSVTWSLTWSCCGVRVCAFCRWSSVRLTTKHVVITLCRSSTSLVLCQSCFNLRLIFVLRKLLRCVFVCACFVCLCLCVCGHGLVAFGQTQFRFAVCERL